MENEIIGGSDNGVGIGDRRKLMIWNSCCGNLKGEVIRKGPMGLKTKNM